MMIGLVLAANLAAGTYTYKTQYQGVDLGTSTLTVRSSGGSTEISEQTLGAYHGTSGNANATLTLDSDLTPVAYQARGSMAGNPIADSATITGDTAQITSAQGDRTSVQLTSEAKHFVVVDLGTTAGFLALPAQMQAWNDAPVCAVVPSFGQSITMTAAPASDAKPSGLRASDVGLTFQGHTPFTVWYDPATLIPDQIIIAAQGIVITRM
jgi:hypothetical protein